jgi:membrane-associated phospholipid phosphatase
MNATPSLVMAGLLMLAGVADGRSQDLPGDGRPEGRPLQSATQGNGFRTLFRDLGGDLVHLPSKDSALTASIGAGLALAMHPADDTFNQKLANRGSLFDAGRVAGNTLTLMAASTATYALGRAFHFPQTTHIGLDLLRAQIVTEAMVQTLKFSAQRPRPNGGSGYSFPSGHAAVTFATAVVLDRHAPWEVSVPAYAFASYVAASRLHDNVHNLSDVVFGAAVGTLAGRTVTRHVVPHFAMVPAPTPGGAAVLFVKTP